MLESRMQAWKKLQYMNSYWMNMDNRNSDEKMTARKLLEGQPKNRMVTMTGLKLKQQLDRKVQPSIKSRVNCCLAETKWTAAIMMARQ